MPRLSQAAQEYEQHLLARDLSTGTATARRLSVLALAKSVGDLDAARVTASHLDHHFVVRASGWSTGTRNNQLINLRLFFDWCRFRGYMRKDSDPLFGWKPAKYSTPERLRIPIGEWSRLFAACHSQIQTIAVATGLYLFLRGSEQKTIQLKHVHLDASEIEIYRTKTREWDTLPISSELDHHLRLHLTYLAKHGVTEPDHYLIPARTYPTNSPNGGGFVKGSGKLNPLRPFGHPYRVIQRVLDAAGYETYQEGEHTLRRSGARAYFDALVDQGYDGALRRVQSMLGHKTIRNTEIYLGLTLDKHRRNQDLRGKPMFPALTDTRIVPIRESLHG